MGGAENFYARFVAEMHSRTDMTIRAFTRPSEYRQSLFAKKNVDYQLFRFGGKLDLFGHWRYRQALKAFQPDVVLTFMNRATEITPRGNYRLVARLGHYYDLKYYRHCDYWIGITRGICDHLIHGGMPKDKVVHIPNFVEETTAAPLPRDSFNTPTDQPLLLAFGRLHVNKGFDVLLRALAEMNQGVLWLAGSGPEESKLRQLAIELGVEHRVRFLGWRNDINALLAAADLFVCPSRHEGLGSILLEAWYHGCPVVAVASQGPAEILTHGDNGMLVPIDDSSALCQTMQSVLSDAELSSQLVANGKRDYAKHYSAERIVGQYQAFLKTIL